MAKTAYLSFRDPDGSDAQILLTWWRRLEDNRADRALLRRAGEPAAMAFVPAYHALLRELLGAGYTVNREALAAVAGLAARVSEHEGGASVAGQMARPRQAGGNARVSDLRFRRLLAAEDLDLLYPQVGRALRLLDRRCNLLDLASAVYRWNPRQRKQWAYDYYA